MMGVRLREPFFDYGCEVWRGSYVMGVRISSDSTVMGVRVIMYFTVMGVRVLIHYLSSSDQLIEKFNLISLT